MAGSLALKAHKKPQELLTIFRERGLRIDDEPLALQTLKILGYYRLSGYAYPLRQTVTREQHSRTDSFQSGSTLSLVVELAKFDKQLRLLALNGLETIELAFRVAIADRLGVLDPEAHLSPHFLDGRFCKVGFCKLEPQFALLIKCTIN